MSNADKALLGVNTMVIAMGIVFIVLIILSWMLTIQSKILKILSKADEKEGLRAEGSVQPNIQPNQAAPVVPAMKQGKVSGEAELLGVEDEELAAVIMAAVSHASSIPLTSLRIKSIKSLNSNWNNVAVQEQMR